MATAEALQEQILPRPVGVGGHAAVSEVSEEALGDSRHQASHAVGGDGGESVHVVWASLGFSPGILRFKLHCSAVTP